MNAQQMQQFQQLIEKSIQQSAQNQPIWVKIYFWFVFHPEVTISLCILSILIHCFLIYNCLQGEQGIDRLTWLFVLTFVPFCGWWLYTAHAFRRLSREG